MSVCGFCGHTPACGQAEIDGTRYCHGDCPHEAGRPSCYELASKVRADFAADMKYHGIHVGMGNPARCVNCGETWPCQSKGPWRCEHTGEEWTGDISNHHGIPDGEGYCPGPHVRAEQFGSPTQEETR